MTEALTTFKAADSQSVSRADALERAVTTEEKARNALASSMRTNPGAWGNAEVVMLGEYLATSKPPV